MAERVRVQKAIAHAGLMSRRAAEEAIAAGRVRIDERLVVLGDRVDVDAESVYIDDALIPVNPARETHLLYKPTGVISTAHDPGGRPTVVDMVESPTRLYPVGRLDADSEGLILLTNDGEMANLVTHPRYGVTKKYLLLLDGKVGRSTVRRFAEGIMLDDGMAKALSARIVDQSGDQTMIEMTMGEGRNREIRRMAESVGYRVVRLVRTAIGPIVDGRLRSGESRRLSSDEVWSLTRSATDHQ